MYRNFRRSGHGLKKQRRLFLQNQNLASHLNMRLREENILAAISKMEIVLSQTMQPRMRSGHLL
jgi:uncharacterized protein YcaQ